jgi:hypothetical protein
MLSELRSELRCVDKAMRTLESLARSRGELFPASTSRQKRQISV